MLAAGVTSEEDRLASTMVEDDAPCLPAASRVPLILMPRVTGRDGGDCSSAVEECAGVASVETSGSKPASVISVSTVSTAQGTHSAEGPSDCDSDIPNDDSSPTVVQAGAVSPSSSVTDLRLENKRLRRELETCHEQLASEQQLRRASEDARQTERHRVELELQGCGRWQARVHELETEVASLRAALNACVSASGSAADPAAITLASTAVAARVNGRPDEGGSGSIAWPRTPSPSPPCSTTVITPAHSLGQPPSPLEILSEKEGSMLRLAMPPAPVNLNFVDASTPDMADRTYVWMRRPVGTKVRQAAPLQPSSGCSSQDSTPQFQEPPVAGTDSPPQVGRLALSPPHSLPESLRTGTGVPAIPWNASSRPRATSVPQRVKKINDSPTNGLFNVFGGFYDQLVLGTKCTGPDALASNERLVEIDLSSEFPPERRQAQVDPHLPRSGTEAQRRSERRSQGYAAHQPDFAFASQMRPAWSSGQTAHQVHL
eukprot:TRINITY_DN70789_c0_g1_i1.p1 TRINITY_DN70789_c0_g1~~TRINITY_DN70789_c0_g1_i1.p1  ORF type:complete len:488 (+),score=79.03 TRINITY_DN70789_c0_g1_i1:73-1536(+)